MSSDLSVKQEKINEVMQSLQRARDLVRSREEFGVEGIHQFVEDVDGDWLEKWADEPSVKSSPAKVRRFKKLLKTYSRLLIFTSEQLNNLRIRITLMV